MINSAEVSVNLGDKIILIFEELWSKNLNIIFAFFAILHFFTISFSTVPDLKMYLQIGCTVTEYLIALLFKKSMSRVLFVLTMLLFISSFLTNCAVIYFNDGNDGNNALLSKFVVLIFIICVSIKISKRKKRRVVLIEP